MPGTDKRPSAVYVSWVTFKNAIDQLSETLPDQIDRTVFPGLAWAIQAQLLTGMKFLGLIDDHGKPTATLAALTSDSETGRKARLSGILRERYADIFALDLTKASPLQVRNAMSQSYGVNGATLDRAMRFFVTAAEYSSIPLSALLTGKKADGTTIRKKRAPKAKAHRNGATEPNQVTPPNIPGTSRSFKLAGGGTLSVSSSVDFFSMSAKDRKFLSELIDQLEAYERDSVKTETTGAVTSVES